MSRISATLALLNEVTAALLVPKGESYTYTVPAFDAGTVVVEENIEGIEWTPRVTVAAAGGTATLANNRQSSVRVRLRSGPDYEDAGGPAVLIDGVAGDLILKEWKNGEGEVVAQITDQGVRAKAFLAIDPLAGGDSQPTLEAIAGLTVEYQDSGPYKRTILRLVDVPVAAVSVTTGRGVGGTKLMTLPTAMQNFLGCTAALTFRIAAAKQADFTDSAPAGAVGIGTLAPANADALGTDATDDDFATAVALSGVAAYAGTGALKISEAARVLNGTVTPIPVFLNQAIDAAEIDDDVTTEILWSGTVIFTWLALS